MKTNDLRFTEKRVAKVTYMRTKKGISRNGNYFTYEVNGKEYWVQGELYYNRDKKRFEYVHTGVRGGETLIFWKENN